MIIQVKGHKEGCCTHPDGPGTDAFAPECCCPDDHTVHEDIIKVDCAPTCVHHKDYKKE